MAIFGLNPFQKSKSKKTTKAAAKKAVKKKMREKSKGGDCEFC